MNLDAATPEHAQAKPFASAIYSGFVRHRRHRPHPHSFQYRICQPFLDLDEIDRALAQSRWWSVNRRNLAQFRRSDYLGDPQVPLADAVRAQIQASTGHCPAGPIRLLAHARYFGHCFNPVSLYYCYAADGMTLDTIVAQITNTPWRERHAYVLPIADAQRHGSAWHWEFGKRFHVSPFLPMQRDYRWRMQSPDASIRVHMDVMDGDHCEFDATLVLQRQPLTAASLSRVLFRYPLMTMKVVAAIHWQALLIWLKRNPVYDHPDKSRP